MLWIVMWEDNRRWTFSLEDVMLLIMDFNENSWICFLQTCHFSLYKMLSWNDVLEWCGLLWCFISCLDSPFDGTHWLQRIHWWATDVISLNLFKWRNKLIYILRVNVQPIFIFGWTILLTSLFIILSPLQTFFHNSIIMLHGVFRQQRAALWHTIKFDFNSSAQ